MKKENRYYVDENNNKWNSESYTEEQAIKLSEALVKCFNMIDCSGCSGCSDCIGCIGCISCSDCSGCSGCSGCSDCIGCIGCIGCISCSACSGCSDCIGCIGCIGCSGCSDCSGCSGCSKFKENPQRYTSSKIGSRNSQTSTYWNSVKTQVVCGCFNGTLEEFEKKVNETYENDSKHRLEYNKFIETCNYLIKQ